MSGTGDAVPESTQGRPRVRYRIGGLLVALSLVPLLGLGWFAGGAVSGAQAAETRASAVDSAVTRFVLLTELKTMLRQERNWAAAAIMVDQLGIDRDVVKLLTSYDLQAEFHEAAARADELISVLELESMSDELALARATVNADEERDAFETSGLYESIVDGLATESRLVLDDLLLTVGDLEGGPELARSLRVLESATTAQRAMSSEFNAFFASQFPGRGSGTELVDLIGQRSLRAEATEAARRAASRDSRTGQVLNAIDASAATETFVRAEEALIDQQLGPGSASGDGGGLSSLISGDMERVGALFRSSGEVTDLYFDLVDAAGADAIDASASVSRSAERTLQSAIISACVVLTVSLLFAAAATRAVVRPVGRLADVARRISDGDSSARFGSAGGSTEIREAGRAIDAAAAHLELAERQARAMADGDLDHPVLARVTTGPLGASLQDAVEALASTLQDREEFRRRLAHEATHDGLTQIANRNATMAQLRRGLARVRRSGSGLAVLFIDLDGFKGVNDTRGHGAGDQVLRVTAQRLVNNVRDGDHVGRLGGDEFLVVAEPVDDVGEAVDLAYRLLEVVNEPVVTDQGTVTVGASIGIAMSDSADGGDGADLLRDADLAVYKAKTEGRSRVEVCDDELRAALHQRADIERSLRYAIEQLELEAWYQPIVDARLGVLRGFEALIRWNRPGHGLIQPNTFIPVAERSDLVMAVDRWMVGEAVRQLVAWQGDRTFDGLPISVNISGRHLASPSLVDDILTPLRDHGIDASRLIVEITESSLLEDLTAAAAKLQVLRAEGMRIAIDDFGTGYTSLAVLKSLPIDILKIDRSYTNDPSTHSLVQLIIDTGHLLGVTITAEGIETGEQARALARMGADELQGYLFGRPCPPGQLTAVGALVSDSPVDGSR